MAPTRTTCAFLVLAFATVAPVLVSLVGDGRVWDMFPGWRPRDMPDMTGKVAIVTGPTLGGIGLESAVEMARKGATVVLAGRSKAKGDAALNDLIARVPGAKAEFMKLDLASLASVKDFATAFIAKGLPLHVLLNNAGVMGCPFTLTADGLEMQFGTNHLGHFLLTRLLLPVLEESQPSRVVTVSSAAALFPRGVQLLGQATGLVDPDAGIDFDSVAAASEATYHPWIAYGRSKLANVLFTKSLAKRLNGTRIYANVVHPGFIKTNLIRHAEDETRTKFGDIAPWMLNTFMEMVALTPAQGATTQLYLATSPEVESKDIRGEYFTPQARHASAPGQATEALAEHLWERSEVLVRGFL